MWSVTQRGESSSKDGVTDDSGEELQAGRKRRRWWRAAALLLLVAGLSGSILGGKKWADYQQGQSSTQFEKRASTVSAAISESVQRGLDLETSFGQLIATQTAPSNSALAPWLRSINITKTYPGTVGVGFVEPVPASHLAQLEQAVSADPIPGNGKGPYPVFPAGNRQSYCLARFGLVYSGTGIPPGVDICAPQIYGAPNPLSRIVEQLASSGQPNLYSLESMVNASAAKVPPAFVKLYRNQYLEILPVYFAGSHPTTVAERKALLVGWVLVDYDGGTVISSAVSSMSGIAISLTSYGTVLASTGPAVGQSWE